MPDLYIADEGKEVKKPESSTKEKSMKDTKHESKSTTLLSYCYYPENIRFTTQDPEEKVILLLRQHPIVNFGWILLTIIMIWAPNVLESFPLIDFLPLNYRLVALLLWYLIVTAFVFEKFLSWYFSVYIVTDERVIDVDFINLIYREITAASVDKIQDVTVQSGGVIMSLFNYGNVYIQTAAERPLLEFDKVPKPDKVARILRRLIIEEEQERIEGRVR